MSSRLYAILIIVSMLCLLVCKDPAVEQKIDPQLRLQLKNMKANSQLDNSISIVFKTNEQLTDAHKTVLEKKGILITGNIGNIYTAKLPARSLYDLAKMRFTESIQGSREMRAHPRDSSTTIQENSEE